MALKSKKYLDYEGLRKVLDNIKNVYLGGIVVDSYITADAYNALDDTEKSKYTLVREGENVGKYRKPKNVKEYLKIAKSQSGSSSVDYWDTVPYTDISGTTYDGIYPDYDIEDGIVVSGKTAAEN